MPPETSLWRELANFGFPALVTAFVLWRVDSRLATLLERMSMTLLLLSMLSRNSGVAEKEAERVMETLAKANDHPFAKH